MKTRNIYNSTHSHFVNYTKTKIKPYPADYLRFLQKLDKLVPKELKKIDKDIEHSVLNNSAQIPDKVYDQVYECLLRDESLKENLKQLGITFPAREGYFRFTIRSNNAS